jgi:hypothetical protein
MGHSSDGQEMVDAVAWLRQRLPIALPTDAELRAMSGADLKRLAASRCGRLLPRHAARKALCRGIATAGFAEKDDFVNAILESAKL